jgi:hypothetical protein
MSNLNTGWAAPDQAATQTNRIGREIEKKSSEVTVKIIYKSGKTKWHPDFEPNYYNIRVG